MKNIFTDVKEQKLSIRIIRFFILFLMFSICNSVTGQSVSAYEKSMNVLKTSLKKETGILDSLKNILNEKINEIDNAKKKNGDESGIKKLMAGTVTFSSKIDEHQKRINAFEKELEEVKRFLNKRYTSEIDSLSALENSGTSEESRKEIKAQILTLTEKKITTAPKINSLSFNPEKILEINLSATTSQEEKKIYSEYLTGALNEVTNQLSQIKKIGDEVNQILTLQKKTKKFLEESEFDYDLKSTNLASRSTEPASQTKDSSPTNSFSTQTQSIQMQSQSFIVLLKQLDLKQSNDFNLHNRFSFDNPSKQLSLKEYRELLKEVEKRLTDYRLILSHKLNPSK